MTRRRDLHSGEAGGASLEVVLVTPMLILLITLVVQFALWSHGTNVALAAAQEGAQLASLQGANATVGEAAARDFLAQSASRLILEPVVAASRTAESATVTVQGRIAGAVPGMNLTVRESSIAPVERYRAGG